MSVFFFILTNNIIPISILIVIGYIMNRRFELNINTLSKLSFYLFLPSFTFVNLYTTKIPTEMSKILFSAVLILAINSVISTIIAKTRNYDESLKDAFSNSVMFFNIGNIGIPLITLVFSNPPFIVNGKTPYLSLALTTHIMIMVIQNVSINTIGIWNAGRSNSDWRKSVQRVLRMPTIYMVFIALILKNFSFDFTKTVLWPPLTYATNALVPTALISLGIQLSKTKFELRNKEVYLAVLTRLLVGPILAILFASIFKIEGIIAQVFVICLALPTAVNTVLIAIEFDNQPNFTSQVVMISTLISSITLASVIYITRLLYPVF